MALKWIRKVAATPLNTIAKVINSFNTQESKTTNAPSLQLVEDALGLKQDNLTFDTEPTSGSSNPVTSGGVYDALALKQDSLSFDSTPTSGSNNPVTSGGVYDALAGKLDKAGGTMTGTLTVNNTSSNSKVIIGSASNTRAGILQTYSDNGYCAYLYPLTLTANRQLKFPDADGTLALTSDVATKQDAATGGTIGAGSNTVKTFSNNSIYLVLSSNNVSSLVAFVLTGETAIRQIENVVSSGGLTLTYSGLNLTITNNAAYGIPYKVMKLF